MSMQTLLGVTCISVSSLTATQAGSLCIEIVVIDTIHNRMVMATKRGRASSDFLQASLPGEKVFTRGYWTELVAY